MTDKEKPKLTLGEAPKGLKAKTANNSKGLLITVILLQMVAIAILLFGLPEGNRPIVPSILGKEEPDLKTLAMELEDRSLGRQAAQAWERYLESAGSEDRPQILYRIGKLYMESEDYEQAAAYLVRADLAAGDDKELSARTGPKMVECLRKLGLYGEVSRELSRRVEVGGEDTAGSRILASLAGESITEADLDRLTERRADQMLAIQGLPDSEATRKALIDQLRSPSMKTQIFQEMLQTELFSRRARELKLDEEESFRDAREFFLEQLLASRFLNSHLEKIQPTAVDLEAFYQAFNENYKDEETEEIPPFEQVRDRVLNDYVARKQKELAEKLFGDLTVRYDVKILAMPGQEEVIQEQEGEDERP
ncbi:MAG: SurA N-terminal domain-containing protein [Planctomycetota bacterium]|jgi:tetratricopeptide (TPR) repeat protein